VPGLNENYGRELMELHPQCQRRLHSARRNRTRARAHWVDHPTPRTGSCVSVRREKA
jgi:hypothetical protein